MRSIFILIFFFIIGNSNGQHLNREVKLSHYAFDDFTPGMVKLKGGETYSKLLNYNIVTNEMIFENEGKFLAIANPENVDTVLINDRKFIPLNNKFYEVLINSNLPLLLEFTAAVNEPGVSVGYGSASATSASYSLKSLITSGDVYELKLPEGFTVIPGYSYWILKNNKIERADSKKQLMNIFPAKKERINELVKKNNTNFSKRDDLIELVKQIE